MPKTASTSLVLTCAWEVFFADIGTAFPTASTTVPLTGDDPWTSIGIVQDDPTMNADITKIIVEASNACDPIAEILKKRVFSWDFDQAQMTKLTIENYFGAGTWATSGSGQRWTPDTLSSTEKAMLFEGTGHNDQVIRILHSRVSVAPKASIPWTTDDAVTLPITATVLEPDSGAAIYIDANPTLSAA